MQDDAREAAAAVGVLDHRSHRLVPVREHDDAGIDAEVKIPKLVTGRDRRNEQILGAPPGVVAAEAGIGRSENVGLAWRADRMRALIGAIVLRAAAGVSGPLHDGPIDMNLMVHQPFR
jgi:hypothetical protein